jgi:hypothetical protein
VVARKVNVYENQQQSMFLMTSGLRSLRDRTVTYFKEAMARREEPIDHLFKAVNLFASQIRCDLGWKVGCLAFDSSPISAAGVDFPIDVVLYRRGAFKVIAHRYEKDDLQHSSTWWQERLRASVNELPDQWIERAFSTES